MKPAGFTYHRPRTRDEVDRLLAELGDEAKILAGGQSLIPILNMRLAAPEHLVDINGLDDEPTEPEAAGDHVRCGPLVRHAAVEASPLVAERVPLLRETMAYVAHPAIRNRGTLVGSIAHADPAAEMPAVLVALEGEAGVRGAGGRRSIPAGELFVSHLETSLTPGEWVEEVRFPVSPPGRGFAAEEFARRHGDYALCGVVAVADRDAGDGRVRVALSYLSMSPVPPRIELPALTDAELGGETLEEAVRGAAHAALEPEGDLHASAEYRMWLAERLGARAARRAAREAS